MNNSPHILNNNELSLLQREEKSILKEIHRICEKNNIKYYIVGGTLLGAVRHKGFIPWDDDIDIAMYRSDYKRFKNLCKKELNQNFFLQDLNTDKGYYQIMPKIRKNNTILESIGDEKIQMHKGVFVDIFMLDYEKKLNTFVRRKSKIHWAIINLLYKKKHNTPQKKFKRLILKCIPTKLLVFIDSLFIASHRKKAFTMNYTSMYGIDRQSFPSDFYGEPVYLQFDDINVYAPKEYIKILESVYGDYMKLPPVEKRGLHHKINSFKV